MKIHARVKVTLNISSAVNDAIGGNCLLRGLPMLRRWRASSWRAARWRGPLRCSPLVAFVRRRRARWRCGPTELLWTDGAVTVRAASSTGAMDGRRRWSPERLGRLPAQRTPSPHFIVDCPALTRARQACFGTVSVSLRVLQASPNAVLHLWEELEFVCN